MAEEYYELCFAWSPDKGWSCEPWIEDFETGPLYASRGLVPRVTSRLVAVMPTPPPSGDRMVGWHPDDPWQALAALLGLQPSLRIQTLNVKVVQTVRFGVKPGDMAPGDRIKPIVESRTIYTPGDICGADRGTPGLECKLPNGHEGKHQSRGEN